MKPFLKSLTEDSLETELASAKTAMHKRTVLAAALHKDPSWLKRLASTVPISSLCEAITHLSQAEVVARRKPILDLLLSLYVERYSTMTSSEKTSFRKSVAYCDETLT